MSETSGQQQQQQQQQQLQQPAGQPSVVLDDHSAIDDVMHSFSDSLCSIMLNHTHKSNIFMNKKFGLYIDVQHRQIAILMKEIYLCMYLNKKVKLANNHKVKIYITSVGDRLVEEEGGAVYCSARWCSLSNYSVKLF